MMKNGWNLTQIAHLIRQLSLDVELAQRVYILYIGELHYLHRLRTYTGMKRGFSRHCATKQHPSCDHSSENNLFNPWCVRLQPSGIFHYPIYIRMIS